MEGAFERQQKTGRDRGGGWKPCLHVALELKETGSKATLAGTPEQRMAERRPEVEDLGRP